MARHLFGGGIADYVITPGVDNVATFQPGAAVTFHNSQSGGTPYADLTLTDGETPIEDGIVIADTNGHLSSQFYGPDAGDIRGMWADGNGGSGPRVWVTAADLGGDFTALDSQVNGASGLVERVDTLESEFSGGGVTAVQERPWEVRAASTSSADVQSALEEVLSGPIGNSVQRTLIIPPGEYHLTAPLIYEGITGQAQYDGLTIKGAGQRSTKIFLNSPGAPFITARQPRFRWLTLSGMTVVSENAANRFAYLYSTASPFNQQWHIEDIEFQGSWEYVFALEGGTAANLNSEMSFERISTATTSEFSDAFFRCGTTVSGQGQENQFLNHWWDRCNFYLRKGVLFKYNRGGSVTIDNCSCAIPSGYEGNSILYLSLPTANSNSPTQNQWTLRRVRFESKSASHKVIDCSRAGGSIIFDNCSDIGALGANASAYAWDLHTYRTTNLWGYGGIGPVVQYIGHQGAGGVRYIGPAQARGGFLFTGSNFFRGAASGQSCPNIQDNGANAALRWDTGAGLGAPRYKFRGNYNVADLEPAWTV